jgi:predicted Zn-dependent peptidase
VAGTKETVAGLTIEMVRDYMSRRYLPGSAVVSVAGNVDSDLVQRSIEGAFSDWPAAEVAPGAITDDTQDAPRVAVEERPTEQVNLCLAVRGLSVMHPDRFAIDLLNAILGEGMSSRLFTEVREKRGLAYDIHSYASHFTDSGSWNVCAGVEPRRLRDAVAAIVEEMARLREDVSEAELTKAREMAKGRLLLRMEDSRNVAAWLGSQELITGHIFTPEDVVSVLEGIDVADLKRLAARLLKAEKLNLAVVGPVGDKDRDSLFDLLKV